MASNLRGRSEPHEGGHREDVLNSEIVSKYINEQEFQDVAFEQLARPVYTEVRERQAPD